jgi:hypothetical protein
MLGISLQILIAFLLTMVYSKESSALRLAACGRWPRQNEARAAAHPGSNYDIAVFIHEPNSFWREARTICKEPPMSLPRSGKSPG